MKARMIAMLTLALCASQLLAQEKTAKKPELKTLKDKASYAFGMNLAGNLKRDSVDIDVELLARGMKDALAGKSVLSEDEADQSIDEFRKDLTAKQSELNKKAEEEFLAANKKKDGVKTTPSGLQYKILKRGTGRKPTANDSVVANYKGTLLNGTEFDSSTRHGGPATFAVKQVIPGWTEALQLMEEGAKWQLFVPAKLAYGEQGMPPAIAPDSMLLFEVELVQVAKNSSPELPKKTRPVE